MNNNFCPLINDYCKSNCIFLEQQPNISGYGFSKSCSLADTVKQSANRPDAEILIDLKKLISKFL